MFWIFYLQISIRFIILTIQSQLCILLYINQLCFFRTYRSVIDLWVIYNYCKLNSNLIFINCQMLIWCRSLGYSIFNLTKIWKMSVCLFVCQCVPITFCNEIQNTKHLLYECPRVNNIWILIGSILQVNIRYKHIVIGNEPTSDFVKNRNLLFSYIAYAIYKHWVQSENNKISNVCQCVPVDSSAIYGPTGTKLGRLAWYWSSYVIIL